MSSARQPLIVLGVSVFLALLGAANAPAANGLGPNGVALEATSDAGGFVTAPAFVDLHLAVAPDDGDATVWVSPSARTRPEGSPAGRVVGSCVSAELVAAAASGVYTCRVATTILEAGVTYRWWIVSHPGPGGEAKVTGPFSFSLGTRVGERASNVTAATAARLRTRSAFTGCCSIKHQPLTAALARAFRLIRPPRTLAVACWTEQDFTSVLANAGIAKETRRVRVMGLWLWDHPRWLQLSARSCRSVERLRQGRAPTGEDAYGLVIALHEAAHAYGVTDEAEATCDAVQLVPTAARALGIPPPRSAYLGRLAVGYARRVSPPGYWDRMRCRDGGAWDIPAVGPALGHAP